ncbi:hypothetical protein ZHAS_00017511 [Anopheles sinensis]|uniref:Uncharacterized protein n=1 Tax=Anopheles sinensis TaxID=74873 RepID=A0A084WGL2_ANOSI|nr:hypothetical protein ZHAS_00017511 [Anopheles sinensis]
MNVAIHKKTEYRRLAQNDFDESDSRTLLAAGSSGSSDSEFDQDEDDGINGGLLSGVNDRQKTTAGRWFRSTRGVIVDMDPLQGGRDNKSSDMYQPVYKQKNNQLNT